MCVHICTATISPIVFSLCLNTFKVSGLGLAASAFNKHVLKLNKNQKCCIFMKHFCSVPSSSMFRLSPPPNQAIAAHFSHSVCYTES